MYTYNRNYGIGKIESIENGMVNVYFAEEDVKKSLMLSFVKIFNTEEEAEEGLNPPMTIEEMEARMADAANEDRIMREGRAAHMRLEEINIEASKKLMKNI